MPFNLSEQQAFIEDSFLRMPQDAESGKKTDSVMKVAEALDLNVLTSHSI